jgi:predicted Zn-dependent peptidase
MDATCLRTILPSGLTVLSERMPDRRSVAVGVWLRNGARDEPPERLGISHFLEHMMFKGTATRDARAIAESLESLGGHLDAFTGREQVCYYARVLGEHLPQAVDVLADITCRSAFAPVEVEREKSVIREEISAAEDNPEDRVAEMISALVWPDHPLGRPILGTLDTVGAFTSDVLREHFRSRYRAENLIVAAAGGLEHDRLMDLVAAHFEPPAGAAAPLSGAPPPFAPAVHHATRDDLQQLYLALGSRGVAYGSEARYAVSVLNTLLGGGMSSRLFQTVREERGLAYSVFSSADFHRDAGMISVHLGVAPGNGREALACLRHELETLHRDGPGAAEVDAARAQLRGAVLMGQESVSNRMYHLAGEEIYQRRHTTPEEHVQRIEAVTVEQVADAARELLDPAWFSLAALGPAGDGALGSGTWVVREAGAGSP